MEVEMQQFRHDLPGSDRVRANYRVSVDTFNRLRDAAQRLGTSANEQCSRAMEDQLRGWVAEEIRCAPPFGAPTFTKAAGDSFPARRGDPSAGFNKTHDRGVGDGEMIKATVRVDPMLLDAWVDAVWYQHDTYPYPSFAFEAALISYLESMGF